MFLGKSENLRHNTIKQTVEVKFVDRETCRSHEAYRELVENSEALICAGGKDADSW
jgi:hypothetical protein